LAEFLQHFPHTQRTVSESLPDSGYFFVQSFFDFVQKIKKRPDIFRKRQRTADNIASTIFSGNKRFVFPIFGERKRKKEEIFILPLLQNI
jgi:hypothetical protein